MRYGFILIMQVSCNSIKKEEIKKIYFDQCLQNYHKYIFQENQLYKTWRIRLHKRDELTGKIHKLKLKEQSEINNNEIEKYQKMILSWEMNSFVYFSKKSRDIKNNLKVPLASEIDEILREKGIKYKLIFDEKKTNKMTSNLIDILNKSKNPIRLISEEEDFYR